MNWNFNKNLKTDISHGKQSLVKNEDDSQDREEDTKSSQPKSNFCSIENFI